MLNFTCWFQSWYCYLYSEAREGKRSKRERRR